MFTQGLRGFKKTVLHLCLFLVLIAGCGFSFARETRSQRPIVDEVEQTGEVTQKIGPFGIAGEKFTVILHAKRIENARRPCVLSRNAGTAPAKRKGRKMHGASVRPVCPRRINCHLGLPRQLIYSRCVVESSRVSCSTILEGFKEMSDFPAPRLGVINGYLG
jgi:hypothetical protein